MLGLFKKNEATVENGLFLVAVEIGRGTNNEMPAALTGAIVPAFAAGPDHEAAAKMAVNRLTAQGFEFRDIQGPIQKLDPTAWGEYVANAWPEFQAHLPSQESVLSGLREGRIFFGPLAGYGA